MYPNDVPPIFLLFVLGTLLYIVNMLGFLAQQVQKVRKKRKQDEDLKLKEAGSALQKSGKHKASPQQSTSSPEFVAVSSESLAVSHTTASISDSPASRVTNLQEPLNQLLISVDLQSSHDQAPNSNDFPDSLKQMSCPDETVPGSSASRSNFPELTSQESSASALTKPDSHSDDSNSCKINDIPNKNPCQNSKSQEFTQTPHFQQTNFTVSESDSASCESDSSQLFFSCEDSEYNLQDLDPTLTDPHSASICPESNQPDRISEENCQSIPVAAVDFQIQPAVQINSSQPDNFPNNDAPDTPGVQKLEPVKSGSVLALAEFYQAADNSDQEITEPHSVSLQPEFNHPHCTRTDTFNKPYVQKTIPNKPNSELAELYQPERVPLEYALGEPATATCTIKSDSYQSKFALSDTACNVLNSEKSNSPHRKSDPATLNVYADPFQPVSTTADAPNKKSSTTQIDIPPSEAVSVQPNLYRPDHILITGIHSNAQATSSESGHSDGQHEAVPVQSHYTSKDDTCHVPDTQDAEPVMVDFSSAPVSADSECDMTTSTSSFTKPSESVFSLFESDSASVQPVCKPKPNHILNDAVCITSNPADSVPLQPDSSHHDHIWSDSFCHTTGNQDSSTSVQAATESVESSDLDCASAPKPKRSQHPQSNVGSQDSKAESPELYQRIEAPDSYSHIHSMSYKESLLSNSATEECPKALSGHEEPMNQKLYYDRHTCHHIYIRNNHWQQDLVGPKYEQASNGQQQPTVEHQLKQNVMMQANQTHGILPVIQKVPIYTLWCTDIPAGSTSDPCLPICNMWTTPPHASPQIMPDGQMPIKLLTMWQGFMYRPSADGEKQVPVGLGLTGPNGKIHTVSFGTRKITTEHPFALMFTIWFNPAVLLGRQRGKQSTLLGNLYLTESDVEPVLPAGSHKPVRLISAVQMTYPDPVPTPSQEPSIVVCVGEDTTNGEITATPVVKYTAPVSAIPQEGLFQHQKSGHHKAPNSSTPQTHISS